jgi:hypothetical protein
LGNWALPPRGDDEKLMFTAPARAQEIEKLSAAWIARRIQSDPVVIEELVVKVLNFNITYSLDDRILEMRRKKASSKVTLHSEVRLHNWFEISERNGVLGGLQFFRRYKYMGTSKPPCKLCSYFFEEYQRAAMPRERWQIRPSHMNLYYNWRYPDIFPSQGEWARKIRTKVMKEMKARLGDDIIRTFFDLTADGRPVDSSTNSVPKGVIKLLGTGGLGIQTPSVTASPTTSNTQDLQQAMGKMSLHTTAHAQPSRNLITQTQIEEPRNSHAGERSRPHKSENKEGENGEDRIVLVFRGRREKS